MNTSAQQPFTTNTAIPPADKSHDLKAELFELSGSRLIEASAGTGKTWTIAALYLRLVLGHGTERTRFKKHLMPSEILVMTFTRAATRELSDRIRVRLLSAAQSFRAGKVLDPKDDFLSVLMADYPTESSRKTAARTLALAAESMDDAAVHTIDSWCQRMLKEHAFDTGNLFNEELVADEEAMQTEAVQDYWRQSCYLLEPEHLEKVLAIWSGVEALIKDMKALKNQDIPMQAGHGSLKECLALALVERGATLRKLKEGWAQRSLFMQDWLDAQTADKKNGWDGRKLSAKNYSGWLATLRDWANGSNENEIPDLKTGRERFTPQGLLKARKADALPIQLPPVFAEFAQLISDFERVPNISVLVRLHAAAHVAQRLLQLKRQNCAFGFSDMLHRLNAALRGDKGSSLRSRILAQYPVILIDEFQDTSPLQYQIFDQIYRTQDNDPNTALLLIGDPKQSIYGFRGADIYSYMQARRATTGRHYVLKVNRRSTVDLVDVVNHCFAQGEMQRTEGAFMYRTAVDDPMPFIKVDASGRKEKFVSSSGPEAAMTWVHDLELQNANDMRHRFAARCAEQIVTWLNDPAAGFAERDEVTGELAFQTLKPADIAVLVRTGKEAAVVQRELARRLITSVYLSDKDSVFDSHEARDLLCWLKAVSSPHDVRLVRAGFATRLMDLRLDELGHLASSDEAFDTRCDQLRQLHSVWQLQGVLAMLRQTVHQLGLAARWLAADGGDRRLTNYLHLAELLQTASVTLDGEQALIRWLSTEIAQGGNQSDEKIVRLESDADLVKIITIHKSKGLEYAVVCLPYATSFREKDGTTSFVNLANAEGHRELHLQFSKEELAFADRDRLREDLRLFYVALTRARHALWVGFAAIKAVRGEECVAHKSGAGYLIGGCDAIAAPDWLQPLTKFASNTKQMVLMPAQPNTPCTLLKRLKGKDMLTESLVYDADFDRRWSIGSFSGLTKSLASRVHGTELSPLQVTRPADDEPGSVPSAQDIAQHQLATQAEAPSWHSFVRGSQAGNFLHEQLEWLAQEQFSLEGHESALERLRRNCERSGYAKHADMLVSWMAQVVRTVLPGPNVALAEVVNVVTEMEFWLPVDQMKAEAIDEICQQYLLPDSARPRLANQTLHGMLMGFADLVFEHDGKFWVLDYKSNHLGDRDADYTAEALAQEMLKHRYEVQAAIYMLALHRLLKSRLGERYLPAQHLGGAVYLFLRGVKGPQSGVCLLPACLPVLQRLDAMLDKEALPL